VHSPKNYLILVLSLTTLAGAVIAWRQYQELITLRAAAMGADERSSLQKRLWAAEKRRGELETEVTAFKHKTESQDDLAAGETPLPNRGRFNGRNNFMAMMEQPEMQRLIALQQKAGLDARYSALFKALALSPEQLDKFKNLLVEKRTSMMDVMTAAREQGINPRSNPEEFQKLVADAQAEIDGNIRSTLGDAAFAQYQDYEKTLPQRNVVNQLEQRLSYSSTPLTSAQSEQLVGILAATSPMRSSGAPMPLTALGSGMAATFGMGGNAKVTDAAINQALGVLAGPQLDALRQIQQEQQAQAEINAAMRARFQKGAPNSSGPVVNPTPIVKTGGG